ncbi:MAG: hypothetical protein JXN63_04595 [Candidatus Delongbacteria bacterium]|nr:hypothetical protein [Candidatus Delongbacteria bacterium]
MKDMIQEDYDRFLWLTFKADVYTVNILFDSTDIDCPFNTRAYKMRKLCALLSSKINNMLCDVKGFKNVNLYARKNLIFSLNGTSVPDTIAAVIKAKYPEFYLDEKNIINDYEGCNVQINV